MPAKKLDELVKKLEADKVSREEIEKAIELVAQMATDKYLSEMFANFTKEEIEAINKATSQEQANVKIRMLFYEKTGKSADELRDEILDYFSQAVLERYLEGKSLSQATQDLNSKTSPAN